MEARLLRLNQIIGQRGVSSEEAEKNKAKAAAIRMEFTPFDSDPKVMKQQQKELERKLAKVGPRRRKPMIKPLIPVSKSAWWSGVASQKFPQPLRIGRITGWIESEVLALIDREE